jgi:hypothetical protein
MGVLSAKHPVSYAGRVNALARKIAMAMAAGIAVVVVATMIWLERRHLDCERRRDALIWQIDVMRHDAHEQLKVGTRKADVIHFFEKRSIPFAATGSEVSGTLFTSGCAPFGCGTDEALIGVRVRVNAEGVVTEEPQVVDLYTNCL